VAPSIRCDSANQTKLLIIMPDLKTNDPVPFFSRIGFAFKVLFDGSLARQVASLAATAPPQREASKPVSVALEKSTASGLFIFSALQREGRLIDFLQQDVAAFTDTDVGAAARVVHGGCKKVLDQYLTLKPVLPEGEGSVVSVPKGYDANRVRVVGNVVGEPPYRATLKHQGWVATEVRFPTLAPDLDARVLAPAEVEI
jgi:hypothetical protein